MSTSDQADAAFTAIWSKISRVRYAMMCVTDSSGRLYSMPLTMIQKEFSGAIWFLVSKNSEQATAIRTKPEVNLAYVSPSDDLYVSLSGAASEDSSREKREELFNFFAKAWFPKGVDDPELMLLRVDIHSAEYWDVKENKAVQLMKIAKAVATHTRPEHLGEHANVNLN